jgi:hypothetical protein
MNLALKRIESLARTKGRHYRFGKLYWVVHGKKEPSKDHATIPPPWYLHIAT